MLMPRLPSLLTDILVMAGVLALSLAVYAVVVEPWAARIEVVH